MWNKSKTTKKLFSFMSNSQTYYHFKLELKKMDQNAGGKWLIHGTKCHRDHQLQSLELPYHVDQHWLN